MIQQMKKLPISALMFVALLLISCSSPNDNLDADTTPQVQPDSDLTPLSTFEDAFNNHTNNIQVKQTGTIVTILSDDTDGDRHQRFIVRLGNNQTLLIAHNIDIAPRVPNIAVNTALTFYGEYEWNAEGGVIHWTHKDPDGVHVDGWLEYGGVKYQ